jgi:protein-tyrosine phosphatase
MSEIIPNLFVGSVDVVRAQGHSYDRIINCTYEVENITNKPSTHYLQLYLHDDGTHEDNLLFCRHMKKALLFIDEAKGSVLVHCQQGISRSCSIILAYLLYKNIVATIPEGVRFIVARHPRAFYGCGQEGTYGDPLTYEPALYDMFG